MVPAGSPEALTFEKKFKQSPRQFMVLRHVRRELGVSSAEIYEIAEYNSVPIFEAEKEHYIECADLKFIERAHQRRGGLVSLRTVGASFNKAIKKVSAACSKLGIYSVLGPDGDKWISTPDYIKLRKHLQKKDAPTQGKSTRVQHPSGTNRVQKPSSKAKPNGFPVIHSSRGFERWRQGEGKALLNQAKKQTVASGGTAYWKETSGGLPTLGRGRK